MLQRQQEPGRLSPPRHPPAAHVWLAVLPPVIANEQWRKVIVRVTVSCHENDAGDHVTASTPASWGTCMLST